MLYNLIDVLFRGKVMNPQSKNNNKWAYGGVYHCTRETDKWMIITDEEWHCVDPNTIGQFTGVVDKNGTKVFEGDVISTLYHGECLMDVRWNCEILQWELTKIGTPIWQRSKSNTMDLAEITIETVYGDEPWSVIVGNIYDNPEYAYTIKDPSYIDSGFEF